MTHQLEILENGEACVFTVRQPAWHKLGRVMEVAPKDSVEAMRACHADWDVAKLPIAVLGESTSIVGHEAVVRLTDGKALGVVTPKYVPVQNRDAFGFFDPMIAEGRGRYETGGVLMDGRVVWAQVRVGGRFEVTGPDDAIENYLLFSNSHDGKKSVEVRYTPIRVVCANTLAMATRGRSDAQVVRIRHSGDMTAKLAEAAQVMGAAAQWIEDTSEAFRLIAKVQLNAAKLATFLDATLGPVGTAASKAGATRRANVRADVARLLDGEGEGLALPAVRGTAWAAYNAVCEYVDFVRPAHFGARDPTRKLASLAFGEGAALKRRALDAALALA